MASSSDIDLNDNIIDLSRLWEQYPKADVLAIWMGLSTNNDKGIILDNMEAGYTLRVIYGGGSAAFSKTNLSWVGGVVKIVGAVTKAGIDAATDGEGIIVNPSIDAISDGLNSAFSGASIEGKVRNFWGQSDGGKYEIDEGGVIVCMPSAYGTIYSNDDTHLKDDGVHEDGRIQKYYKPAIVDANSFFPCNRPGGLMEQTAKRSGAACILAWDKESAFGDNVGWYEIKVVVSRPGVSGEEAENAVSNTHIFSN
ncbi:MAG: hypothetical protein VB958_15450 [Thalassolituus sp.]|uniref:hypothetical protein n=1 Tax=Thalassolituus sp. TaxID=2030822 RepID=UPI003982CB0B